jgi:hypothetical protein
MLAKLLLPSPVTSFNENITSPVAKLEQNEGGCKLPCGCIEVNQEGCKYGENLDIYIVFQKFGGCISTF